MDTLTAELTPQALADILQEPEKALLARVLKMLGQERCAQVLADTLSTEAAGGLMLKDGSRRRTAGGTFFQLARQQCTTEERARLFPYRVLKRPPASGKPSAPSRHGQAPPAPALAPMPLTISLWKGLRPMAVTASLKLVLPGLPETRERDGMVYMALHNEPKGLPKGINLENAPIYLTSPVKQWKTACQKAAEMRATGLPALLIVEAHVSTREGALIGVVKGIQVTEGKAPVATPTA